MGNKRRAQRARRLAEHQASDLVELTRLDGSNYHDAADRLLNTGPEPCRECGAETAPGCSCEDCAEHRVEFATFLDPGEQVTGTAGPAVIVGHAGKPHFGEA